MTASLVPLQSWATGPPGCGAAEALAPRDQDRDGEQDRERAGLARGWYRGREPSPPPFPRIPALPLLARFSHASTRSLNSLAVQLLGFLNKTCTAGTDTATYGATVGPVLRPAARGQRWKQWTLKVLAFV